MTTLADLPGIQYAHDVRFYSLARYALAEGLRSLGIGKGHSVLLPEYICRDLLASVRLVGAAPVYYPTNERLQPSTDPKDWPRAEAVVAVNYFGFAQPLEVFEEYCRINGARLVEDNAHGFLSRDQSGAWLGLRGEIGLFSLRKTFLMVDGAALAVRAEDAALRLMPPLDPKSSSLPKSLRLRRAMRALGGNRKPELMLVSALRWLRQRLYGYAIKPPAIDGETQIPGMPEPDKDLFRVLEGQDFKLEAERRRQLFISLLADAPGSGCQPVFGVLPDGTVPYGFPVYADNLVKVARWASRFGLDCFYWPDLPDVVLPIAAPHYSRLYVVNFL